MAWPSSRHKTAAAKGSWTPADMNGVQDQYIRAAGIQGDDLATDVLGAYRNIQTVSSYASDGSSAGDNAFGPSTVLIELADNQGTPRFIYLDDADYTISGRTPKLRVRAQCYNNATASTITYTVGLYPMTTFGGGIDAQAFALGAVISGSTVAFASPTANSLNQGNSGDFTFPADGHYALGVNLSGVPTANARALFGAQLQLHWT